MEETMRSGILERVDLALDTVRGHLEVDGGNVKVLDISDDFVVSIEWMGNCQNCSMSEMTLRAGIEQAVKNHVPEVTSVVPVN